MGWVIKAQEPEAPPAEQPVEAPAAPVATPEQLASHPTIDRLIDTAVSNLAMMVKIYGEDDIVERVERAIREALKKQTGQVDEEYLKKRLWDLGAKVEGQLAGMDIRVEPVYRENSIITAAEGQTLLEQAIGSKKMELFKVAFHLAPSELEAMVKWPPVYNTILQEPISEEQNKALSAYRKQTMSQGDVRTILGIYQKYGGEEFVELMKGLTGNTALTPDTIEKWMDGLRAVSQIGNPPVSKDQMIQSIKDWWQQKGIPSRPFMVRILEEEPTQIFAIIQSFDPQVTQEAFNKRWEGLNLMYRPASIDIMAGIYDDMQEKVRNGAANVLRYSNNLRNMVQKYVVPGYSYVPPRILDKISTETEELAEQGMGQLQTATTLMYVPSIKYNFKNPVGEYFGQIQTLYNQYKQTVAKLFKEQALTEEEFTDVVGNLDVITNLAEKMGKKDFMAEVPANIRTQINQDVETSKIIDDAVQQINELKEEEKRKRAEEARERGKYDLDEDDIGKEVEWDVTDEAGATTTLRGRIQRFRSPIRRPKAGESGRKEATVQTPEGKEYQVKLDDLRRVELSKEAMIGAGDLVEWGEYDEISGNWISEQGRVKAIEQVEEKVERNGEFFGLTGDGKKAAVHDLSTGMASLIDVADLPQGVDTKKGAPVKWTEAHTKIDYVIEDNYGETLRRAIMEIRSVPWQMLMEDLDLPGLGPGIKRQLGKTRELPETVTPQYAPTFTPRSYESQHRPWGDIANLARPHKISPAMALRQYDMEQAAAKSIRHLTPEQAEAEERAKEEARKKAPPSTQPKSFHYTDLPKPVDRPKKKIEMPTEEKEKPEKPLEYEKKDVVPSIVEEEEVKRREEHSAARIKAYQSHIEKLRESLVPLHTDYYKAIHQYNDDRKQLTHDKQDESIQPEAIKQLEDKTEQERLKLQEIKDQMDGIEKEIQSVHTAWEKAREFLPSETEPQQKLIPGILPKKMEEESRKYLEELDKARRGVK
jgi:hypothetical protein